MPVQRPVSAPPCCPSSSRTRNMLFRQLLGQFGAPHAVLDLIKIAPLDRLTLHDWEYELVGVATDGAGSMSGTSRALCPSYKMLRSPDVPGVMRRSSSRPCHSVVRIQRVQRIVLRLHSCALWLASLAGFVGSGASLAH